MGNELTFNANHVCSRVGELPRTYWGLMCHLRDSVTPPNLHHCDAHHDEAQDAEHTMNSEPRVSK